VMTASPGALVGDCAIGPGGLAAHCRIGRGRATIVADGEEHEAPAGTFCRYAPSTTRTVRNKSDAMIRVLLIGVPGCGKSLVAKTLARSWGMPLVSLDPGAIFGSFVGESEERLRRTLRAIESMSPVVVWVDEIEKGFAASASARDGGVGQRVLGGFLSWLQERHGQVFLVATCNDVESLPPELLRRGRFDETFFVDLPGPVERDAILRLHLERRHRDPSSFDVAGLVTRTEGFSGAELEGVIVGALYRAFAAEKELDDRFLREEADQTAPLSRTRAEDIVRLRAWSEGRAVAAGTGSPATG